MCTGSPVSGGTFPVDMTTKKGMFFEKHPLFIIYSSQFKITSSPQSSRSLSAGRWRLRCRYSSLQLESGKIVVTK
jgi:hypothetical protein